MIKNGKGGELALHPERVQPVGECNQPLLFIRETKIVQQARTKPEEKSLQSLAKYHLLCLRRHTRRSARDPRE